MTRWIVAALCGVAVIGGSWTISHVDAATSPCDPQPYAQFVWGRWGAAGGNLGPLGWDGMVWSTDPHDGYIVRVDSASIPLMSQTGTMGVRNYAIQKAMRDLDGNCCNWYAVDRTFVVHQDTPGLAMKGPIYLLPGQSLTARALGGDAFEPWERMAILYEGVKWPWPACANTALN